MILLFVSALSRLAWGPALTALQCDNSRDRSSLIKLDAGAKTRFFKRPEHQKCYKTEFSVTNVKCIRRQGQYA